MENLHQNVIPQAVDELVTPGDHQQHTTAAANTLTASDIDSLLQNWTHDNTGQLVRNQAGGDAALLPDPDRLRRTRALGDVLHTVQQLWYAGSEEIDAVAQILANGSRTAGIAAPMLNLAIPASSRPLLGDLLTPDLLPAIWSLDPNTSMQTPQLHFAAVSLTRLLLTSTPQNVRRLCAPLSPDPLSPLSSQTLLHRLLDVFARADPTQAAHTRTEAARAALAVVRVLHTTPVPPLLPDWDPRDDGTLRGRGGEVFYRRHGALGKTLAHLVVQPKFGVLRSEAWFVFALMARSEDGAGVVSKVLAVPGAWEALVECITGRREGEERSVETAGTGGEVTISTDAASVVDGLQPQQVDPQQAEGMARVDRENGLVLVSELVKHAGEDFPAARRAALGEMLKEGGELVAEGRKDDSAKDA
ncbi:conserved hypothetical protein [Verticillium alfalfae VaMs.102]|uniref:Uncharacterized protein n=1 Tax=Verticillium alfalfae (strain VaMs.102 / ATCC MYA-4576 / FGSC 10136) TaxID=526221 RepID=C9SXN2_VERA1|nr:conserved hypothetical protein [Verticillium alfalfae VaMs.102]EEY23422.1 conserved hypothetical protein [Verticillium alfalfae VaMs.102]